MGSDRQKNGEMIGRWNEKQLAYIEPREIHHTINIKCIIQDFPYTNYPIWNESCKENEVVTPLMTI